MLKGKTALVTGSFAGLGLGVAEALAAAGANVVIHGLCDAETGQAAASKVARAHGVTTMFSGTDLTSVEAIEGLVTAVADRFGRADIIVNNAVLRNFKPVEDFTGVEWDASLAVNLSSAFHLARLCVPAMKASGWGRIVNMSSIYGVRGAENRIDYVTTKTALLGMTRALAIELARTGITCNAVSPGTVPTEAILTRIAGQAEASGLSMEEAETAYLNGRNPTGRFVSIEAVGALVAFLCGPQAADITGANMPIDGGWSAI
ncbi:SDR family oxidoreductase [Mesorhizobium zhangyense]|uniref:SDR family oxidoreductase n=1 Tax=Mesorhizobium zhangyense TaxID=1776730 RepID=UPI001FEA497F|nr:SDR family oxidoreductase [Mesorhizobium zhangyense]